MDEKWRELRLGEVITLKRGYDLRTADRNQSGTVPVVSSSGITGSHDEAKVQPPGVVTGRYGTVGKVFYLTEPFWPLNTTLYVRDFKGNDPYFIYHFLHTINFERFSDKTGVPGVDRNDLHRIRVSIPPLPEQRKIAEILGTWDEAIALTEQRIEAARQRKKGLMQRLLTGGVRFPEFVGEQWKLTNLRRITKDDGLISDGDWVESKDQDPNGNVRLVQLADVGDGHFLDKSSRFMTDEKAAELKCTFLEDGDILLARMPDPLGRACIFPKLNRPCVTAVDVCVIRVGDEVDRDWLMHAINAWQFRKEILRRASGTTRTRISRRNLEKIPLMMPSLQEQRKIAAVLQICDREIELLTQKRDALQRQKKGLMQRLLTGRVRVEV